MRFIQNSDPWDERQRSVGHSLLEIEQLLPIGHQMTYLELLALGGSQDTTNANRQYKTSTFGPTSCRDSHGVDPIIAYARDLAAVDSIFGMRVK